MKYDVSDTQRRNMTTEQMVGKCFYPAPINVYGFACKLYNIVKHSEDILYLARAARRFVEMERRQKYAKLVCQGIKLTEKHLGQHK